MCASCEWSFFLSVLLTLLKTIETLALKQQCEILKQNSQLMEIINRANMTLKFCNVIMKTLTYLTSMTVTEET